MPRFLACSACHRHVRADVTHCPFCSFGPLRCAATPPARWLLVMSMTAGSLGLLACTDGPSKKPSDKPTTAAPAQPGGADVGEPTQPAKAEVVPDPEPEPEKDIYGGPRMMDPEPAPEPTIYGGPRMDEPTPLKPPPEQLETQ